ncbi:MAG TPA: hypothetical protein VFI65_14415 [Streptosporangiaceae bacterium]|nr:hypothetical protein [Streptosporangiaceae bacterium]
MKEYNDELPEIESFNMSELDVSGLDTRLELTTLMPEVMTPDCGPSFLCSCFAHG